MSISKKLIKKLEEAKVKHEIVCHKKVFTAFDAAATLKVKLEQVVKSLLIKAGKDFYLALLPANRNLDFKKLSKVLNVDVKKVSIPKEKVMTQKYKVKPGAMSAFGSVYKIPVVLDKSLIKVRDGIFSSGSFVESLRIKTKDYLHLENPVIGIFSVAKKYKKPKQAKTPSTSSLDKLGTSLRAGKKSKPKTKPKAKPKARKRK